MKVRQPGHVTRIVSGCNTQRDRNLAQDWFDRYVSEMSSRFHLHIMAPSVADMMKNSTSSSTGTSKGRTRPLSSAANASAVGKYHYFNKPFGVQHWMKETFQQDSRSSENDHEADNDIIILIDPDMILLKPLVPPAHLLRTGQPVAQRYGYHDNWRTRLKDVGSIVGEGSPAIAKYNVTQAKTLFPAGPPYMVVRRDMQRVSSLTAPATLQILFHIHRLEFAVAVILRNSRSACQAQSLTLVQSSLMRSYVLIAFPNDIHHLEWMVSIMIDCG